MDFKSGYKYFLDFLIALAFISLNIVHQSAHSKDLSDLSELSKPSASEVNRYNFGMDFIYMSTGTSGDYSQIFRKTRSGTNFYIGYNWDHNIMLEIGYTSTTRRSKTSTLPTGTIFLGQPGLLRPMIFTGKVRFRNTHIDLNFFTNFYERLNIVTAIGISFVRPRVTLLATDVNSNPVAFTGLYGKTNTATRAGLGLYYSLNSNTALRSMTYFDQYSKIRLRIPGEPNNKPFKNSYTTTAGVLFSI